MALPTPPPASDTSHPSTAAALSPAAAGTSTATTTTAHAQRPPFPPNPRLAHPHPIYTTGPFYPPHMMHPPQLLHNSMNAPPHDATTSTPAPPNPAVLYPVASSGRGFLKKQAPLSHSNPNSHPYPDRSGYNRPLFGYPQSDPGQAPGVGFGSGRPTHLQQQPGVMPGVPVAPAQGQRKMTAPSTLNADSNGHRDARERSKDDSSLVLIRDRKVRMSESASLYSLCRSWLKTGPPEESQPVYMHGAQSLPKPSPAIKVDMEEEVKEEGSVEDLTPEELLQTHIRRAKRVRLRLREERRWRIERYKTRLALVLTPMIEQQMRNDPASGK